jgi:predicted permease
MELLVHILLNLIFPLFSLIGIGACFHRMFKFDMNTLSKLVTYFLLPAVGFVNIYTSQISGEVFLNIIGFLLLQSAVLMIVCHVGAKWLGLDKGRSAVFKNSVVLNNSGNYGISVSQLVFQNNPIGLSIQIVVMVFQNVLTYSYGLLNSASARYRASQVGLEILKMPILYTLAAGFILRMLEIDLASYLMKPIENASKAFTAVALFTLGAQVAYIKFHNLSKLLAASVMGRLILAPVLAFFIIELLGLTGVTAQALLIASAVPSSRNSALFALEYNNHPEQASQAVLVSTILSCITVSVVVYLSKLLYG